MNDNLVLIGGEASSGKSASLMFLKNQPGCMYLNCESKKLPFRSKFIELGVVDPYQIYEALDEAETMDEIHTIIIDSSTFMMDMFESVHVIGSENTMAQWGAYQQFFRKLMLQYVARSTKNVIMTAHVQAIMNEQDMVLEKKVPVKGALKANGIESFFSTVVTAKRVPLKDLKEYDNDLLEITDEDKLVGYKHVFQTRPTMKTSKERMRSPLGMWSVKETYISNDCQKLMQRLVDYYAE